jgi:PAS domain S-box-containing protein
MSLTRTDNPLEVFKLLVNQSPDAIVFADRQGMIQVWNNAAGDLFGYAPDEVLGTSLDVIIPEHLRLAHWTGFNSAVASGQTKFGTHAMRTRATHKTGHKLYVSLAFSVVHDPDGKVIGAMATAREIIEEPLTHQPLSSQSRGITDRPLDCGSRGPRNSDSRGAS